MIHESQEDILQRVEALEQKAAETDGSSNYNRSHARNIPFKKLRNENELVEFAKEMKNKLAKNLLVRHF